jgi:hypothetical protein
VLTGEWAPMPRDAAAGEQRMRRLLSAKEEPQSRGRRQL